MPSGPFTRVLQRVRGLLGPQGEDALDAALLARFTAGRDETAFAELVRRHGPLVLRVCRQVLRQEQDAEDAFQATFLVLACKAAGVRSGAALAGWLYRVAYHVAVQARARTQRQQALERQAPIAVPAELPADEPWPELHEEIDRLPEKYRLPVVLCGLGGQTHEAAAAALGWPLGTLKIRLTRARDLLKRRLTRRGVALSAAALALLGETAAHAEVPALLVAGTAKAAILFAAGQGGATAPAAVTLARGVLHTMFLRKLKLIVLAILPLALGVAGVGLLWPRGHAADPAPLAPVAQPVPPAGPPAKPDPAQAKADHAAVIKGNTALACDLYARVRNQDGNLIFSPYSVSTAAAATYAGARGDTARQMEKALHFPVPADRLAPAYAALMKETRFDRKGLRLRVDNELWGQKGLAFNADLLATLKGHYGTGLQQVDFKTDPEAARKTINAWVEKKTEGRIKDVVPPGAFTDLSRFALTNTVYFKGDWEVPFHPLATKKEPFTLASGKKVMVPMMTEAAAFDYFETDTMQALGLPYVGAELAMAFFLPRKADGLPALEKALTAANLDSWLGKLKESSVWVWLPKFKTTYSLKLKEELMALGVGDAFDVRAADLSGFAGSKGDLVLENAFHKATIAVTEEGTEATAATGVAGGAGGIPQARFRADHPFVFVIYDTRSRSVLFLGRLVDPER